VANRPTATRVIPLADSVALRSVPSAFMRVWNESNADAVDVRGSDLGS